MTAAQIKNGILSAYNGAPALRVGDALWVPNVDTKTTIKQARNPRKELVWWATNRPEFGHWVL